VTTETRKAMEASSKKNGKVGVAYDWSLYPPSCGGEEGGTELFLLGGTDTREELTVNQAWFGTLYHWRGGKGLYDRRRVFV